MTTENTQVCENAKDLLSLQNIAPPEDQPLAEKKQSRHQYTASNKYHIAIVAGEESGDILGAGLIGELKKRFPHAEFSGIGGRRMQAEGFFSFFPQDRLAVMGFIEPLKRLPELLRIRAFLKKHYIQNPPDIFIGIDSPDFNLNLELVLRERGIKTAHYVSPSVWAWREGRIKKIKRAADLMLTLFPFENAIYEKNAIKAVCVGHPLADSITLEENTPQARHILGLEIPLTHKLIALLPGSRQAEVARLGALFFSTAQQLMAAIPNIHFVCPAANPARLQQLTQLKSQFPDLPLHIVLGQSHAVMAASDLVIMASGTTTLEAMLFKKPMVIAYKVAPVSYWIYRQLVKIRMIGLPNLLAGKLLVPEFIQQQATVPNLTTAALNFLTEKTSTVFLKQEFVRLHKTLRKNGNVTAAQAITQLIENT